MSRAEPVPDPAFVLNPKEARRLSDGLREPKIRELPEKVSEALRQEHDAKQNDTIKPWRHSDATPLNLRPPSEELVRRTVSTTLGTVGSFLFACLAALALLAPQPAVAQLCEATCLDVETLGAATVYDQETGTATMYDGCTYTDCSCTATDAASDPVWICCNESTQHGWGSFGDGCVSYAAGEVIVYGIEGAEPAPIPEPGEPSWSLIDWLGDLLRELPEHNDHGGVILVDLWPEWHTRDLGLTQGEWGALLEAWGVMGTEDGADDTPTLDDPSERGGAPLGTEDEDPTPGDGTPTAGQVEAPTATPAPLPCPPGTTPAFGGILCLGSWSPFGDWREVDWSIEPDLKDEPCGGKGQPPCPGAPLPVPPCPPRHFVCPELGCCPHGDPGGMDPRTPPTDEG